MQSFPELAAAVPIILSLIVIESLLSVDNALAIAAMASHLPGRQKVQALRLGIVGAYAFRGLALAGVHVIIAHPWLKIMGAAYLIHLMATHFAESHEAGLEGHNHGSRRHTKQRGFWSTVLAIELMDLSLSVDNVVAAVAMSPKLWVVCGGVFIGMLAMRFVAGWCIKLIERHPILEEAAFLLIGYVGVLLIVELTTHVEIASTQKFIGLCIILALSLAFSKFVPLQRLLAPPLKIGRLVLTGYGILSAWILRTLSMPFRLVSARFKASPKSGHCPPE